MAKLKIPFLIILAIMLVTAALNPGTRLADTITWIFLALAVIHLIEFFVVFKVLRTAGGSMFNHFVQTIFFGAIYWMPIKQSAQ